jgi:TetR/AcrR family transcriptional repressor of nem operon
MVVAPMKSQPSDSKAKLLQAALRVFREKGYTSTTVDDLCRGAGVTKGSFFHHFASKEDLALAAIDCWNKFTGALFAEAPYWQVEDPRARLLAYVDFRAQLVQGTAPEYTCLLGTLVQETFDIQPTLREACRAGIENHAQTLVPTIEAARAQYAPGANWSAEGLALHTQAVLQGGFILAKARGDSAPLLDSIDHLRRHIEFLLPINPPTKPSRPRRKIP